LEACPMSRFNYGCKIICNENDIYPAMKQLIEKEKMTIKGAAKFLNEDSGGQVTVERARGVWNRRKKGESHAAPDNETDAVKASWDFKNACQDFGITDEEEKDKLAKWIARNRRKNLRKSVKQYTKERANKQAEKKAEDEEPDPRKEFVKRLKKCEKLSNQLTGAIIGIKKLLAQNGYGAPYEGQGTGLRDEAIITMDRLKKVDCDSSFRKIVNSIFEIYRFQKFFFEDVYPPTSYEGTFEKRLDSIRQNSDEAKAEFEAGLEAQSKVRQLSCTHGGTVGEYLEKKVSKPTVEDTEWYATRIPNKDAFEFIWRIYLKNKSEEYYSWRVNPDGTITAESEAAISITK
jgi:hypothetical protein